MILNLIYLPFFQRSNSALHWAPVLCGGKARRTCLPSLNPEPWQAATFFCLLRAGWGGDRRNATSLTCSHSTGHLTSHSTRTWAGSLAVFALLRGLLLLAWALIWMVWLWFPCNILLGLRRQEDLTLAKRKGREDRKTWRKTRKEEYLWKLGSTKDGAEKSRQNFPQAPWSGNLVGDNPPVRQSSDWTLQERESL